MSYALVMPTIVVVVNDSPYPFSHLPSIVRRVKIDPILL